MTAAPSSSAGPSSPGFRLPVQGPPPELATIPAQRLAELVAALHAVAALAPSWVQEATEATSEAPWTPRGLLGRARAVVLQACAGDVRVALGSALRSERLAHARPVDYGRPLGALVTEAVDRVYARHDALPTVAAKAENATRMHLEVAQAVMDVVGAHAYARGIATARGTLLAAGSPDAELLGEDR